MLIAVTVAVRAKFSTILSLRPASGRKTVISWLENFQHCAHARDTLWAMFTTLVETLVSLCQSL